MNPARWIALWAGLLAVLTALMAAFGGIDPIAPLLLGGVAAGTLLLALVAVRAERRTDPGSPAWGESPATALAALGIALLVGGAEFGAWMLAIGASLLVLGAAGLVRERRTR
jgi:hypothetical protein